MLPIRPKPFKAIYCVMLSPVFSLKLKLIPAAEQKFLRHAVLPTALNDHFMVYAFHSLFSNIPSFPATKHGQIN